VFADDNGRGAFSPLPGVIDTSLVASLAPNEDALIAAVVKANPNTIVVLNTDDPVLMPWLSSVKGVLEMWYPGQEGGTSTAKLLLGQVNPGGKLPISWPGSGDQTLFDGHPERITGDGRWCSPKASIWATVGTASKTLRHCFLRPRLVLHAVCLLEPGGPDGRRPLARRRLPLCCLALVR